MGLFDCEEIQDSYPLTEAANRVVEWATDGIPVGVTRMVNDVRVEHKLPNEFFIQRHAGIVRVRRVDSSHFEAVSLSYTEPERLPSVASQAICDLAVFMSCQGLTRKPA